LQFAFASLLLVVAQASAVLAEEDWSEFDGCVDANLSATDIAEPSIHGGADLIVDVLCVEQATWLINAMILNRDHLAAQPHTEAFESARYVLKRETKSKLFKVRTSRLGL